MKQFLQAGEIVATHGLRGEVKILPWADDPEFLLEFDRLYVGDVCMDVEDSRVQKTCVLVKLRGVDTVEQAARLVRQVVSIDRGDVELEQGVHFIADLIGLKVIADGKVIGTIHDVLTMPGNDVYVVHGPHRYMIPVVRELVDEPDFEAGTVTVRLLEGMRDDEN